MVTVKLDDITETRPCRYLNQSQRSLYDNFATKFSMSKSTFLKILRSSKIFKKPFRETDLCDYCEWSKDVSKEFSLRLRKIENYICSESVNFSEIIGINFL